MVIGIGPHDGKLGAQARLKELETERRAILTALADIGRAWPAVRRRRARRAVKPQPPAQAQRPTRKRRTMSAEERKAVSERMKKYWAARTKAKAAQNK